jgi:hypothetical protein
MEAWDHEPRVRPVPIEDDDNSSSDVATRTSRSEHWTKKPWLPIALSAVAVVGVLTSVAVFGAVEHEDPPPLNPLPFANPPDEAPVETTAVTMAPQLEDIIAGITDRLTLIVVGPDGPAAMLWDPSFVEPKIIDLGIAKEGDYDYEASFDSSGRFIALASTPVDSQLTAVHVGVPTEVGDVDLVGVTSIEWHATEVGTLAFVQPNQSGEPTLYTARVNPLSRTLNDIIEITTVEQRTDLLRWDADGFILTGGQYGGVHAFDDAGVDQWSKPGHALAASAHMILISPLSAEGNAVTTVEAFTRDGEAIGTVLNESVGTDILLRTMSMSKNSDLLARIDMRQERTRLEVTGPQIAAIRIVQHNDDIPPIGFTSNDEYFVFEGDGNNDLVFIKWNIGAIFELDVPEGYDVIGFDIG